MEEENDKLYCHHCNSLKLIAEKDLEQGKH